MTIMIKRILVMLSVVATIIIITMGYVVFSIAGSWGSKSGECVSSQQFLAEMKDEIERYHVDMIPIERSRDITFQYDKGIDLMLAIRMNGAKDAIQYIKQKYGDRLSGNSINDHELYLDYKWMYSDDRDLKKYILSKWEYYVSDEKSSTLWYISYSAK